MVVVPMASWSRVAEKALRFAYALSKDVIVLHVNLGRPAGDGANGELELEQKWDEYIARPAKDLGLTPPQLAVVQTPYRFITTSIVKYVLQLEHLHPNRLISVVVPELVERKWLYSLLHDQRTLLLKLMLRIRGNGHIVVSGVPWYLEK